MAKRPVRQVALLGGINVGGHRVSMERLRAEFTRLGLDDVSTFIASGNALFTAPVDKGLDDRIAAHLEDALGWPVPTWLRTADEIRRAVELRPFGTIDPTHTHMVVFCRTNPNRDIEDVDDGYDRFVVDGRDVHWHLRGTLSAGPITLKRLATLLGQPATTRNTKGLTKLSALLSAPPGPR